MILPRTDIVVVGAGPIGMTAALSAARNGCSVTLLDRNPVRPRQSRAIGITPPSLGVFKRLGIIDRFLHEGVCVRRGGGYSRQSKLCVIDFSRIPSEFPFILTLPQDRTEALLEESVFAENKIFFLRGAEVCDVTTSTNGCAVIGKKREGDPFTATGDFLFGCDGGKSITRQKTGISFQGGSYPHTFLMADYEDSTGWGDEARLYFTSRGSAESFPLPGGCRRFVLRTPFFIKEYTSDFFEKEILIRSGVALDASRKKWESGFGVQHFLASSFATGRIFLCGDAAHLMSPIGGQNMNVGFGDAECAAWLCSWSKQETVEPQTAAAAYHRFRKRAAKSALMRAEIMMRLGTSGGFLWNGLRDAVMAASLFPPTPLRALLTGMFTMLSLPNRDLPNCLSRLEKQRK